MAEKRNRNLYLDSSTYVRFKKFAVGVGNNQDALNELLNRSDELEKIRARLENPGPGVANIYPPR